jgi:Dolichyl-phosphate-mannose-protein mannosyltransferase
LLPCGDELSKTPIGSLTSPIKSIYMAAMGRLKSRWQALSRGTRLTMVALLALLAGGIGVRAWLMVDYGPAFLGYPDSAQYDLAAALNIFRDAQRPAGYPLLLRLIHYLSSDLWLTILVQHAMGLAAGLLLYKAVRRTGAPAWLGLVPAAILFFGGTGLILEHSLLADAPLTFLQALGVYLAIRAVYEPSLRWPVLTGLVIGACFWLKTVAVTSAVVVPFVLIFAAHGRLRRRLLSALCVLAMVVLMVCVYIGAQYFSTGYLGYERQSAWNLYGRVATFVNCSSFIPPKGTRFLCPSEPVGHRKPPGYYQGGTTAPAVEAYGFPWRAPPEANGVLETFSVAAIEHEPVAYAKTIVGGLGRYVFPSNGEGSTPSETREAVLSKEDEQYFRFLFARFFSEGLGYIGSRSALSRLATYEKYTLIQGPLLVFLLVAAIAGVFFLPLRLRWASVLFTLTAISSITFAVAGNSYDARYAYPTFGPLAAGAALGAWGIGSMLVRRSGWSGRRRSARYGPMWGSSTGGNRT